ncbi:MAG: RimK family alpha-L-glutamate ligase [Clostridia bacterium]|jgi:RimK family alpha-L-glutamate ligase|nr:RimK family alpha-L-glutamate ligase [Clostridia bacterium]
MNQLTGWMISNGGLKTQKYMESLGLYEKAARELGIQLEIIFNHEIVIGIQESVLFIHGGLITKLPDFVLFLDKDIRLAYQLERLGLRVFNSSKVIAVCDDKSQTFQELAYYGIPMPKTLIAPLVFQGMKEDSMVYIEGIEKELSYPIVMKESYGSFGEQVYLVQNREELMAKRSQILTKPHIYQEFIGSSKGRDVRVNIVGGQVVAAMLRTSSTDFRANISNGGQMQAFTPPQSFKDLSVKVCAIIGADFAGVDLLFGEKGEPIVCEVNSNAHIKNIQLCTGINVAAFILQYILKELRDDTSLACLP